MSTSRLLLRIVLVVMIIGLLLLGVFIWRKGTPDYYWSKAQTEIEAENYEAARLYLVNLVRRHPTHADGLELLSRVIVLEGRSKGRPPTFQANPAAVEFLAKAAEMRPADQALQERLLRAHLAVRQLGKAADVAEQVYKTDPKNADANFALIWRAVEKKNATQVAKLYEEFRTLPSTHVFQVFALVAKYHWDADEKDKSDEILAEAASVAQRLKAEELGILERRDREAMLAMLLAYQDRATEAGETLVRAQQAIDACQKLSAGDNLIDKRIVANAAAQSIAMFNIKYPPIHVEPSLAAIHADLAKQAEQLGSAALADKTGGPAPMLVYWITARSHMTSGDLDKALVVLDEGLKAAKELKDAVGEQHLDLHLLAARILIMKRDFPAADKHLDKLLGQKKFDGWAHLLKGSVALHEGRLQVAETEFAAARKSLGDTVLVKMSLAHTAMALEQWDKAIPMLEELLVSEESLTDEQRAWFVQLLGSGMRVHFDLLRAKLAQKNWADAQPHLRALKGSDFETSAWAMAITYKWDEEKDEAYAKKLLDLSRQKFSDDLGLVLLEARLLSDKGQSPDASRLLEKFAAAAPQDERRQLALARWLIRNREANKALTILEALAAQPELTDKARNTVAVYRVQALIGSRQYDLAKEEADGLTTSEATKTAGYLMKAALAFREQDQPAGIAFLEEAKSANPRNPQLNMLMSNIYKSQGEFEKVLEAGADVMDIHRFTTEATASVSEALQKMAQEQGPDKALAKVDALLATRPNDFALRVLKVDFLVRMKEFEKAMRELDIAERQSPDDLNVPRLKAQVLLANDRKDEAFDEAVRGLKRDAENADAMLLAAQMGIVAGKFKEAVQFADAARRKAPANPQHHVVLADALRRDGRVDDAVAVLKGYSQRNPKDSAIRATIVELLRSTPGRETDAINEVRAARRAQPEDLRLLLTEIEMLADLKRSEEAQSSAREALGQSAKIGDMLSVAQAFANADEVVHAQYWARAAEKVAKANERPQVNLFLGRLYLREGSADGESGRKADVAMLEKARAHFAAVLEAEPRHLIAGNNLAWLLAQHFDRASESLRIVEQVRGAVPVGKLPAAFIDTMAICYQKAGQKDKAKIILKDGLLSYPTDPQLLFRQGMLLAPTQPSQAKAMLQQAVDDGGLAIEDEDLARQQLERL